MTLLLPILKKKKKLFLHHFYCIIIWWATKFVQTGLMICLLDNFQDQMKRELSYREEMVQQLHIVRGETHKAEETKLMLGVLIKPSITVQKKQLK